MSTPKVWFITGASIGFGRAVTEEVLLRGDIAVATLRKPEAISDLSARYGTDRLLVIKLDVTNHDEISAAFNKVKETFGRLDVVFNNAGYSILGEIEGTSEEESRALFEVNFWGSLHIAKEAVKFFREVNAPGVGGFLLQNSSMAGLDAIPGFGVYSATGRNYSHFGQAIEGAVGALRKELYPSWNIRVVIIEPGGISGTRSAEPESLVTFPVHPAYNDPHSITAFVRKGTHAPRPGSVQKTARVIYELSSKVNLPLNIPLGQDSIDGAERQIAALQAGVEEGKKWVKEVAKDE